MTQYNGNIGNLLQGVSQQPRRDRRPEQLESQVNCYSNITKGLGKRPGTFTKATGLGIVGFDNAAKHTYSRGDGAEKYTIAVNDGTIDVVDLVTGTERTVNLNGYDQYLESESPEDDFRFYTIADTTIIVNKTIVPEMDTPTDPSDIWQALVYAKRVSYGFKYTVYSAGSVIAQASTPATVTVSSTSMDKSPSLKTTDLIDCLYTGATVGKVSYVGGTTGGLSEWANTAGVTIQKFRDTIYMYQDLEAATVSSTGQTVSLSVAGAARSLVTTEAPIPAFTRQLTGTAYVRGHSSYWTGGDRHRYMVYIQARLMYYTNDAWYYGPWSAVVHCDETTYVPVTVSTPSTVNDIKKTKLQVYGYAQSGTMITYGGAGHDYYLDGYITSVTCELSEGYEVARVLEVDDANFGTDLKTVGQIIDTYDDLPSVCYDGYKVQVRGIHESKEDDYYVQFEVDNDSLSMGQGIWRECAGFGIDTVINPLSMPHKLIRSANGEFDLQNIEWVPRRAGDDNSNPKPSFIGKSIEGLVYYQERLVFLTGENMVASVAYDQFNFFATSVIQESDSDPIDVTSSDNQVTNLLYALVYDASLIIFSDNAQFIHPNDTKFIPNTVTLSSKTRYSTASSIAPVASASSLYFPYNFGVYTGIREFYLEELTSNMTANMITQHVSEYLYGTCVQIESTTDYNLLLTRTAGSPNSVYVYEWYDEDRIRKQAAWHRWDFDFEVLYITIIRDTLYVWYQWDTDQVAFVTMDLSDQQSPEINFPLRLDKTYLLTSEDISDTWRITIDNTDFLEADYSNLVVVGAANSGIQGAACAWTQDGTYIYVEKADLPLSTGVPKFYVGVKYDADAVITNPYVRSGDGKAKTHGRTQLKTMKFNCSNTGKLYIKVKKKYSQVYEMVYDSKIINSDYILNSQTPLLDAEVSVPIRSDSAFCTININSDSHLPFYITDIDWSADYTETGRRTL